MSFELYMNFSLFYKAEGIILKRKNIGEADKILTLFTKQRGKIRLLAKGIRKITSRRSGHLEVFSHVYVLVRTGKSFEYITEVTSTPIDGFRTDLRRASMGYYVCELVDALMPDHEEHVSVFELLHRALRSLSTMESEQSMNKEVYTFALALLETLGYLPRGKVMNIDIHEYIEHIVERKLKTPRILTKIAKSV